MKMQASPSGRPIRPRRRRICSSAYGSIRPPSKANRPGDIDACFLSFRKGTVVRAESGLDIEGRFGITLVSAAWSPVVVVDRLDGRGI